jgi:hypothetical protein
VFSAAALAPAVAGLGAVSGTVRDASGAVVPGATVTLTNAAKGISRTMQSSDAGVFSAPALDPSSGYSLAVEKSGFAKWETNNFEILVGQTVDFKVMLEVSGSMTKVDVTAEAPLVENTKTGVSQVVESAQIAALPINGRRRHIRAADAGCHR